MNERVKELALDAKLGPALMLHYWKNIDALTDTEQEELEQLEKFAELIVRECVGVADHSNVNGKSIIGQRIKEHFGVEE